MENIVLTQNGVVLNQVNEAINKVFRPSNIRNLHPNRELTGHGWDNFYHLRITVDLSKCNKDWLRQILTSHYNSDQYVWSYVTIDLADDGELNIYFHFRHSMLNIVSQFAEVDNVILQIDRSAISILDPTVTRFVDKGTKLVDGYFCKVYTIYLYDQQSRYYDDFTEAVETRYTQDPFNFHKVSVSIERIGSLSVSLFKRVEDNITSSNIEYVARLQHQNRATVSVGVVSVDGDILEDISAMDDVTNSEHPKVTIEKCLEPDDPLSSLTLNDIGLYRSIIPLLYTKVIVTGGRDNFSIGHKIDTDIDNPDKVFEAVALYFVKTYKVFMEITHKNIAKGVIELSVKFPTGGLQQFIVDQLLHPSACAGNMEITHREWFRQFTDAQLLHICSIWKSLESTKNTIAETYFIDAVTRDIDHQLLLFMASMKEKQHVTVTTKWLADEHDGYSPTMDIRLRIMQYYEEKGYSNVSVIIQATYKENGSLVISVDVSLTPALTPATNDGSVSLSGHTVLTAPSIGIDDSAHPDEAHEPSKIDTVDEQLDKVISGIERLKWLYNQATEQNVHDRINSKINRLVETSVSSTSNLCWGEYDPDNKIPAIIEKLQWIRSNTNNANGTDEAILALINKLVMVAARDLME